MFSSVLSTIARPRPFFQIDNRCCDLPVKQLEADSFIGSLQAAVAQTIAYHDQRTVHQICDLGRNGDAATVARE